MNKNRTNSHLSWIEKSHGGPRPKGYYLVILNVFVTNVGKETIPKTVSVHIQLKKKQLREMIIKTKGSNSS